MRLPLVSAAAALAVLTPVAASASSSTDSQFVSYTNSARSHHGLRHYSVRSDLTSVARRWAAHMARHRHLSHNPSMTSQVCCWSELGENVGVGSSAGQIQRAFMNSYEHRDNILSRDFTQVGIGTARGSDGRLYVDEVFRRTMHRSSYAAPVRRTPVRASRAAVRAPLHQVAVRRVPALHRAPARPSASVLFAHRLAATRRDHRAAVVDPVAGALDFASVMAELEAPSAH